jgi:hypothetical protein
LRARRWSRRGALLAWHRRLVAGTYPNRLTAVGVACDFFQLWSTNNSEISDE